MYTHSNIKYAINTPNVDLIIDDLVYEYKYADIKEIDLDHLKQILQACILDLGQALEQDIGFTTTMFLKFFEEDAFCPNKIGNTEDEYCEETLFDQLINIFQPFIQTKLNHFFFIWYYNEPTITLAEQYADPVQADRKALANQLNNNL